MNKKIIFLLLIIAVLFPAAGYTELIVNEVLANEPAGNTSLEWIELYNDSSTAISFSGYQLKIGSATINLPDSITLASNEYFIVCRRLFANTSSPGFESFWGDSSGVWGDTPEEAIIQTPWEATFSLYNNNGTVLLLYNDSEISSLAWTETGLDGYSWERVFPYLEVIGQSIAPNGSTPGMVNSLTPVSKDLSLDSVQVEPSDGNTFLTFYIKNSGTTSLSNAQLILKEIDTSTFPFTETIIDRFTVPSLASEQTQKITKQYSFGGIYIKMEASLTDDDRPINNSLDFVATGSSYPPLILSELMANPQNGLNTEWLEIKNRSEDPVDLSQWRFGDAKNLYYISSASYLIEPGEYLILAQSTVEFIIFYTGFNHRYIQPDHWPTFNNDSDIVRLVDIYNIEADRFVYNSTFDGNYTWSHGEKAEEQSRWGRSENEWGTPGGANLVVFKQDGSSLTVQINPDHISPDNDGFEDFTDITISAPPADDYTVKVYDKMGRVVKTFYDKEAFIPAHFQWDGRSDAGRRLPIGIYILYVEAGGIKSIKQPIVIAR